jgi:hypothetical protein
LRWEKPTPGAQGWPRTLCWITPGRGLARVRYSIWRLLHATASRRGIVQPRLQPECRLFMTRPRMLFLILGLLAASTALSAVAPRSYLDGNPKTRTDPLLNPVQVLSIDGEALQKSPTPVAPGAHWVELQTTPVGLGKMSRTQTFVMKIDPCTYYYLGAHKDPGMLRKWKLVVDEEDSIKGCDPAEELKNARNNPSPGAPAVHPAH